MSFTGKDATGATKTFASDTIGGTEQPKGKLVFGADGTATDVYDADGNRLPVAVTSVVPGSSSTSLGKAEDAPHASGDVGVMTLAVRKDAASSLSSADGDYTPLQTDANGALRVSGAGGGTEFNEDAPATSGDLGKMVLAKRVDTAATQTSTDGDYTAMTTDSLSQLRVNAGFVPAARNTTDTIAVAPLVDIVIADAGTSNPTALTVKRVNFSITADTTLIAAVASKKILILAMDIDLTPTTTIQIDDGSGGTRILGPWTASRVLPFNPAGWAKGSTNTLVHGNFTSGTGPVTGTITYVEV